MNGNDLYNWRFVGADSRPLDRYCCTSGLEKAEREGLLLNNTFARIRRAYWRAVRNVAQLQNGSGE